MEEESKISFWKKLKLSIFNLEEYQKLAVQKISKTIIYIAILMLIFAFFSTISSVYVFHKTINNVAEYIENNIEVLDFKDGSLSIKAKDKPETDPIVIDDETYLNGKIIINTNDLTEEQVNNYANEISTYTNGILILKDKIVFKTYLNSASETILFKDFSNQFHIVNVEKQDIINIANDYTLDIIYGVSIFIVSFINNLALVLLDAVLYSFIGYAMGMLSRLRLKYTAIYNITIHSLTLPIILNLIYTVVNTLTGYTISYFPIMYTAITCIYIFTAILMIKSDVIKKQLELSKIIEEQERVKQEIERREQEKREEEEKERVRKKDEKQRKEEKNKQKKEKGNGPEPQANIKASD